MRSGATVQGCGAMRSRVRGMCVRERRRVQVGCVRGAGVRLAAAVVLACTRASVVRSGGCANRRGSWCVVDGSRSLKFGCRRDSVV